MSDESGILEQATYLLEQIESDRTVPRNIREAITSAKKKLGEKTEPKMKIDAAIQILDEIINDPNLPVYTRTQIWNVVSMLEEKRREL